MFFILILHAQILYIIQKSIDGNVSNQLVLITHTHNKFSCILNFIKLFLQI